MGNTGTITASGGGTYKWNTGQTTPAIIIAPVTDSIFTVQITKNGCNKDTSFQVNVHTKPNTSITPGNKICLGKPFTLTANGACNYKWSNGATTSSIVVTPGSTTTYSVLAWCYNDTVGCDTLLNSTITVDAAKLHACCDVIIISGDTALLTSNGSDNYIWAPNFGLSCDTCPNPTATPSVTVTYTISSIDTLNGCTKDTLITVTVNSPCNNLYVPNVFTPNNDGINDDFVVSVDTLTPTGERSTWNNFTFYYISIFDRWGKEVFTSTDPTQPWNGRVLNTQDLAPDGVYYYVIKTTCGKSNSTKKGFVELLGEK
ncbi:MAG: gliding motility-associated C-terminal domain-containing protein [Candidatus Saccharimonadales bacterium]